MGLDMYLDKYVYVGAEFKHRHVTGIIDIQVEGKNVPINFNKVSYVIERAGYWRKANAIHQWFVDNVQGGEDNCGTYFVTKEAMQELLDDVNSVLKKHKLASSVLPITDGFFFGSTDYDKYYFEDLRDTKAILEEALKPENQGSDYYYHSSW